MIVNVCRQKVEGVHPVLNVPRLTFPVSLKEAKGVSEGGTRSHQEWTLKPLHVLNSAPSDMQRRFHIPALAIDKESKERRI